MISIAPKKGSEEVVLESSSRKLAPVNYFTKEELPSHMPEVRVQPLQLISRGSFEPMQMPADDRPRIFGMPMFLGYYWGQNDMGNNVERNGLFDSMDPFNF
mgnify:CR=1 FL=1